MRLIDADKLICIFDDKAKKACRPDLKLAFSYYAKRIVNKMPSVDACPLMNVGSKSVPDAHSGSTELEWISTKEMLPMTHGTLCLVLSDGIVEVGCWSHDKFGNGEWFYVDGEYEIGVTHWMPIPEPPKG